MYKQYFYKKFFRVLITVAILDVVLDFYRFCMMYSILVIVWCKFEFNQPSCWLYSVPNLLVF